MFLIQLGALMVSSLVSVNCNEEFLEAVHAGNLEAVRPFVNGPHFKEEMLNTLDDKMQSPLYVAMDKGHVDVALELIKKNPDFNLLNKKNYESYLHLAIRRKDLAPCLEEMLNRNADPNIKNKHGSPVLHSVTSLQDRSPQIINLLIQKGASTEMTDGMECTAIHKAIENINAAAVVALCENKADVEVVDPCNRSALHHALYDKNLDIIKALVEIGNADIEKKDSFGCTALSSALNNNSIDVAFYLLSRNANVNAVDIMGNSILEKALATQRRDLVAAVLARNPIIRRTLTHEERDRKIEGPLHTATLFSFHRMNTKLNDEGPSNTTSRMSGDCDCRKKRRVMYSDSETSTDDEPSVSEDESEEDSLSDYENISDSENTQSAGIREKALLDAKGESKVETISSPQAKSESSSKLKAESSMTRRWRENRSRKGNLRFVGRFPFFPHTKCEKKQNRKRGREE